MKNRHKILCLFIIGLLLFDSCKDTDEAPMGAVDFRIDLYDSQFIDLKTVGGFTYLTGGYNGIVIFNNNWEFITFERACPVDHSKQVEVDASRTILECPECESKFLYLDGSPLEGSKAKSPLRQYSATYDGVRFIYVSN